MKIIVLLIGILCLSGVFYAFSGKSSPDPSVGISLYDIPIIYNDGKESTMADFKGKVILIVNVASKCGYTRQYSELQELYERFKDKGVVVLGVPSNDFMGQEPGSDAEILSFCKTTYGVTFPLLAKTHVKGKDTSLLYQFLISKQTNPSFSGKISWNFNKFVVDRKGSVVGRFGSSVSPLSDPILSMLKTNQN